MLKNAFAAVPADILKLVRRVSSAFAADAGVTCMASLLDTNDVARCRPLSGGAVPPVPDVNAC